MAKGNDAAGAELVERVLRGATGVAYDSRRVRPGDVFVALPGERYDGHDFAAEAVAAGATGVVAERPLDLPAPVYVVPSTRAVLGPLAAAYWGNPSRQLAVVGITGTNGKTTTAQLLAGVLGAAGRSTEIIGTLTGVRTTPEAPDLQQRLAEWRDDGVDSVAMEVSSHALAQGRVDGTWFELAVFTNLSHDHLDYHGSLEAYFAAKASLFEPARTGGAIVNRDDPYGARLLDTIEVPATSYGLDDVDDLRLGLTGSSFRWRGHEVQIPLAGRFNVSNALAAAETAMRLEVPSDVIVEALEHASPAAGRFELVDAGQAFPVIVDYAHTPTGLAEVLDTVREVAAGGRVIVVFGCGGDRDVDKRPLMGAAAVAGADVVILTSDNPRSERPEDIVADVLAGVEDPGAVVVDLDRRSAIRRAVADAGDTDAVVIAGKGHETTQTTGSDVRAFDDRVVAHEELAAWNGC